jgi:hypothetical protein
MATVVVVVLVLLLTGVLLSLATRSKGSGSGSATNTKTTVPERGPNTAIYDRFDRSDVKNDIGKAETGQTWQTGGSKWSIEGNTARMETTDPPHGITAVINLGSPDGRVQVTIPTMDNGAGLVFRYQNAFNYWQVTAAPKFATWSIRKIVAGQSLPVGNSGLSAAGDGTTIAATFSADRISIQVNGKDVFSVIDTDLEDASFVGMVGNAGNDPKARFDNFVAEKTLRPVVASTEPATDPSTEPSSSSASSKAPN